MRGLIVLGVASAVLAAAPSPPSPPTLAAPAVPSEAALFPAEMAAVAAEPATVTTEPPTSTTVAPPTTTSTEAPTTTTTEPEPTITTEPPPARAQEPPEPDEVVSYQPESLGAAQGGGWAALRQCESSGNYATDTGNGYSGAYQFDQRTWESVGGTGRPADASPAEQDHRAALLYASRGAQPWPECGRYL